jgi:hypothetical protein
MIVPFFSGWTGRDAGKTKSGAKDFWRRSPCVVKIENSPPSSRLLQDEQSASPKVFRKHDQSFIVAKNFNESVRVDVPNEEGH